MTATTTHQQASTRPAAAEACQLAAELLTLAARLDFLAEHLERAGNRGEAHAVVNRAREAAAFAERCRRLSRAQLP